MLYVLALHIIFIVTWFAGLFYIVRLFIYHREAQDMPEPERGILSKQFKIMQRRLWYGITWPSFILTFIFGPWLFLVYFPEYLHQTFFQVKLGLVVLLGYYHFHTHMIFSQLQKDEFKYSSAALRIWNEVASIFLVAIVFVIELKGNNNYLWMAVGIFTLIAVLFLAIKLYKKSREGSDKK